MLCHLLPFFFFSYWILDVSLKITHILLENIFIALIVIRIKFTNDDFSKKNSEIEKKNVCIYIVCNEQQMTFPGQSRYNKNTNGIINESISLL